MRIAAERDVIGRRVKGNVAEAEWAARVELAACYRMVDHYKMSELVYTHLSLRVPDEPNAFLLNAYGLMFDEVTASNLVKVDASGNILSDETGYGINTAGFVIHSAVHSARRDIACVMHVHTPATMGVSAHPDGLLPITQHAVSFHGRMAYHDYEGISFDMAERERLVSHLGDKNVMFLRNHGVLTCGRSVPEAFLLLYILERACQAQAVALAGGVKPTQPSPKAIAVTANITDPVNLPPRRDEHAWNALVRMIDRIDNSYRN